MKMLWMVLVAEKKKREGGRRGGEGRKEEGKEKEGRKKKEGKLGELQDNFNQPNIYINVVFIGEKRMGGRKYLISWLKFSLFF